ncbi:2',3'-cyclic-nucleotide 3'-phosphodiesterase [Dunckerocampus dactyliophorus]|uniref:2',3'-cyclic-nucleotide 3'-phosphodiesterase n=1 Tax=Dunckerocampus dactyliophorus TaxID=161453 RepID=UPI002404FB49|nr:2',3'-cyclic-nucleotide 3'-phosphodiesterase [Dunckerocampus dactyliophorus]
MDPENNGEVSAVLESPQQQEEGTAVAAAEEKEVKVSTGPENPVAADEEEQVVNGGGHDEAHAVAVTGTVSQERVETEGEDSSPQPEAKMVPEEPIAAPEKNPEPDPDPDDLPELIPEADVPEKATQGVTAHEPQAEPQPPSPQEKTPEQVKAVIDAVAEVVSKEVPPEDRGEPGKEEKGKTTEASAEKMAQVVVQEEKSAEAAPPAEPQKETEPEKSAESVVSKAAESSDAVPENEAPPPAAGSMSFALLEHEKTKDALQNSRTLVVLRGLPGSGKSFLARALEDAYKDRCSILCADNYGVKPENQDSSAEGHKALDEAVVACCANSSVFIVVDDTNHTQDRLARLGELAREHHLVVVFLEPCTEWSRDATRLAKMTGRKLKLAQITSMKRQLEEVALPLYFGWFLLPPVQDQLRSTNMGFLKALENLDAFKKQIADFSENENKEVDLTQYFKAKGSLHCTTKFCNYGKATGAKEYAEKPAVAKLYGSVFELSLTALFVTPRTAGARVSLTEEQLQLWPSDAEKEAESSVPAAASLPAGSRAHITLGCAKGVEPVRTGLDLLEILALQQEGQQGDLVEDMDLGPLRYYGKGRWMLELKEPMCVLALFSSFYKREGPESVQSKKESKKKCTIL